MLDFALIGFVFFGLFSPGPNVILVTTSGARFGLKRTLPHIAGVVVGAGIIAGTVGLGVGAILFTAPKLELVLKIIAMIWILWMALQLWMAQPLKNQGDASPFTFLQAVLFQWVNPKVWAVAISASAYTADLSVLEQTYTLAATFSTLNIGVCFFWTGTGALLSYLLETEKVWRLFMRTMAVSLAVFSLLIFL